MRITLSHEGDTQYIKTDSVLQDMNVAFKLIISVFEHSDRYLTNADRQRSLLDALT